jgi:hypothetical protein
MAAAKNGKSTGAAWTKRAADGANPAPASLSANRTGEGGGWCARGPALRGSLGMLQRSAGGGTSKTEELTTTCSPACAEPSTDCSDHMRGDLRAVPCRGRP